MELELNELQRLREEGALWRATKEARRFWLFGRKVKKTIYVCDECCCLFPDTEAGD